MELSPPPPSQTFHFPPLHSSGSNSFPVIAIALIGILATAFLLVGYYIFVIKCCLNWHRVDVVNRFFSRRRNLDDEISTIPTSTSSPEGNSTIKKGLDEAIIRSIPVIKFRKLKDQREQQHCDRTLELQNAASYECAVCLSEFEEGERLRVIPNCCHAFHIDCIDIWLQSNANCPLCRSGISPSSILHNTQIFSYPQYQNTTSSDDNFSGDDDDYVVIEIQGNNLDEPRLVSTQHSQEMKAREILGCKKMKKLEHVCSMGDELIDMRKKDEEFQIDQPIRRSISMDMSSHRELCHDIQQYCRNSMQVSEVSSSSNTSNNNSSSKVRRSIFSFGYGRGSRGSVQPVHLDP